MLSALRQATTSSAAPNGALRRTLNSSMMRAYLSSDAAETTSFPIANPPAYHLQEGPVYTEVETSKAELLAAHQSMYTIRRMEIACDTEYKARSIRGFCHLYDGQEAVAQGMTLAMDPTDDIITTYRCHAFAYLRGSTVMNVLAELFGRVDGTCRGKGGSMHFYSKKHHFWGGAGIVGAQVPVGAGIALANKQATATGEAMPVVAAMYGDGAANQGQVWEAANMSKLWGLPLMLVCENNQYGMGTSVDRSSANTQYYKQGGVVIPGIQIDGMDVLAVKAGTAYAKEFTGTGNGPLYVEYKTYRYHGHSMSDPGITYRAREEVSNMRSSRDCIELVKSRLLQAGWATEAGLKATEKEIRSEITAAVAEAKASPQPPAEELVKDILYNEIPEVRMPDRANVLRA